ncbi:autotransporter domain-containing protein [Methylomonas lenta]|nr:autotransporter domain-containing protein [Methylomonas lenta]
MSTIMTIEKFTWRVAVPGLLLLMTQSVLAEISYEITNIGLPSDSYYSSHAQAINDLGQVAGYSDANNSQSFGFTWQDGQFTPLQSTLTPEGQIGSGGYVANIDEVGQVVGNYGEEQQHAFIWQNGSLTDLGTFGGSNATALASNASGQVWESYTGDSESVHLLQNGVEIQTLAPGDQVISVNTNGQAIIEQDGDYYLLQIAPGALPTLLPGSFTSGQPTDINNAGQIVGFYSGEGDTALLWDKNGNPIDLNTLSNASSFSLARAFSINNLGQIVGEGYLSETTYGFIATPTGNLKWNASSGAWDNTNNWDSSLGFTPNALLPAVIQGNGSNVEVSGPASDTMVKSLSVGQGTGTAKLDLNAGSLTALNQIDIYGNGTLNLSAPQLAAQSINNQGVINISGSGSHRVMGDVTNTGTFKLTDTSVQYTGNFTNNGAYLSDPSTSQFNNLNVGSSGYLVGGAGDQFIVTGDFNNSSTQNTLWNTANADLIFAGPAGTQHVMGLTGVDRGVTDAGSVDNFAWGSMTLNNGNLLSMVDGNTTPGAALYASRLILPNGLSQLNGISSNYNIYFDPTLAENQYLLGAARSFGSGSGQLLPWSLVPFATDLVNDQSLTPNQQGFGAALAEACTAPTGALVNRCLQLQGLSDAGKKAAIASLTPDQVPGQMAGPIKFSMTRMDAPFSRLASLRSGNGTAPLSFNFNGVQVANLLGRNALGGAAGDDDSLFGESPLGVFLQTRFTFGDQQNTLWDRGFSSESRAVTLGTDYRFTEQLVAGLAFNYTNQSLSYDQSAGYTETNSYMGAVYGSYFLPQDFYIDWVANYGSNEYTFNRQYRYTGFSGQTQANPSGEQYNFALSSGKSFNFQEWGVNPYVRAEFLNMHIGQYQEQGGNGFDTTTAAQSNDSFVTSLGAEFSYTASMNWGVLIPAARVEWEHQYLNDNRAIQMRLTQAGAGLGNFVIQTGAPDRDYVNLGGSLSATLPNGGAGFVRYETRLGQSAISDHIVEGGIRLSF